MQARFPVGASCKFAHGSDGGPQEKRRRATCVPAVESIPVPELHDSDALDREQTCYLFTHLVSTRTKFVEPEGEVMRLFPSTTADNPEDDNTG